MKTSTPPMARRRAAAWLALLPVLGLASCAMMPGSEPPRVNVVGVESLKGEGLELRFAIKLRVQNPNDAPIEYDGISIELDVNGKTLASGVSGERGTVPRFGEAIVTVPVSISAISAIRQAIGVADGSAGTEWPYALRGRLATGTFGSVRFASEGTLRLPRSRPEP
jgi:LEA14-like dessication related protein